MKKLLVTLAAVLVSVSAFAQGADGTITFHNRNLATPNPQGLSNVPINGVTDPASARAQLYLVSGNTFTPLTPIQTFRTAAGQEQYFVAPVTVSVTGQAPGTTGLQFVVRAWQGAATYDAATIKGQSLPITPGALGGVNSAGTIFFTPDLGGPNGLQSFALVPEPSTIALGVLGAAALLYRRRK